MMLAAAVKTQSRIITGSRMNHSPMTGAAATSPSAIRPSRSARGAESAERVEDQAGQVLQPGEQRLLQLAG